MPSAAGKRVGRVLARVFEASGGDKPGLLHLARILGFSRDTCIGHQYDVLRLCHVTDIDNVILTFWKLYTRVIQDACTPRHFYSEVTSA